MFIPLLIRILSPVPSSELLLSNSLSPLNSLLLRIVSDTKLNKLSIFTSKNLSLATINTWAIRAEDYVDDTENESRKIKVAGSFLTETAEL
jgi:hypothetical protein